LDRSPDRGSNIEKTFRGCPMEETRSYAPLLYFIGGLIVTSVALVAAAMAVMKDAWGIPDWKLPLLSFLAWMSVTIFVATIAGAVIQWRRSYRAHNASPGTKVDPKRWEKCVAFVLPSLPGLLATWQLIRLAWITVKAPML
jgi:hypothetical protein